MRGPRGQRGVPVSTKGAFLLSELAAQTGHFVNGMYQFEGEVSWGFSYLLLKMMK